MQKDRSTHTLLIASVLYENAPDEVLRLIESVAASVDIAHNDGLLSSSRLALGDCSLSPVFADEERLWARVNNLPVGYDFFEENLGHSAGCNRLASGAKEDFILFLNPDCYLSPRAILGMLQDLLASGAAATDCRQIPLEHPKWYDPESGETSWLSGACLLIKGDAFDAVGGFDEANFWSYVNDVDISWRLRSMGWQLHHSSRVSVFHDKRLDPQARVKPTATEVKFATLGQLLLATRWGREDVVESTLGWALQHGTDAHKAGAHEFLTRRKLGATPVPIYDERISQEFIEGDYGSRRF